MNFYSKSYITKLKTYSEQKVKAKIISATNTNKTYTPLVQQISALVNSLPSNLVNRPWSMSEFVSRLEGKYKARPHPQKVAEALKILGWKRVRFWRKGYDGVRLWFLP